MSTKQKKERLAYYITPHGFGHAIRSLEVVNQLLLQAPELEIVVVSTIPEFLFEQNLQRSLSVQARQLDIGLVQQDSLRFDMLATLKGLESLHADRTHLLSKETNFLETSGIQAVICDIPFLPFAAASQAGISQITAWIPHVSRKLVSSDTSWIRSA